MWNIIKEKELERKLGLVRQFLVLGAHQGLFGCIPHIGDFLFGFAAMMTEKMKRTHLLMQKPKCAKGT